jgi:NADP-dependent aldehyde dehydrogenase
MLSTQVPTETSDAGLEACCRRAEESAAELEAVGRRRRAKVLDEMAAALEQHRAEIVATADAETSLGEPRLDGELTRTCFQLRFMGALVAEGSYLEATIDHAGPTPMGARPDLRRVLKPLGPVAVFGASNFPLAFSVAGGDTASALAAGCPVVVKAHPAHPATSALCAQALVEASERAGLHEPPVGLVFGEAAGVRLVQHPAIKAIGFTGSLRGGRSLFDLARSRPDPVPFYGELGALNPLVVAPGAAERRAGEIAKGLAASFTLGVGQFCTKPGLLLAPAGPAGDALKEELAAQVSTMKAGRMLTKQVAQAFAAGSAALASHPGVKLVAEGVAPDGDEAWWGTPLVLEAEAAEVDGPVTEECFGPVLVLVRYRDLAQLSQIFKKLKPALTVSLHADLPQDRSVAELVNKAGSEMAGRVVWGGYPTGVAVSWAMHHGGPYPATTDPLHTSVGAAAIRRWLRPVCYQDFPQEMLPPELRDDPPPEHQVPRRVDGELVLP